MLLPESLLDRMIHAIVRQALDGLDRRAFHLNREQRAGLRRLAIDAHHAGAALAGVTSNMRAGKSEMIAKVVDEEGSRLDVGRSLHPIDGHGHMGLLNLLGIGQFGPLSSLIFSPRFG